MALDEQDHSGAGTDIGRALDEAFHAMEKDDRRKLMVLLTDGEDLEKGGVRDGAKRWRRTAWWCSRVGVGTPAGAEIQVVNDQGQMEFVRDDQRRSGAQPAG